MNELILPPEPRPSKGETSERPTIEIVVEPRAKETPRRRGGVLSTLLGAAAILGAGAYLYPFVQSALQKQPQASVAVREAAHDATHDSVKQPDAALGDAQRQIAALQTELRDLRAKLDAVEKRQQDDEPQAKASPPAPPREAAKEPREATQRDAAPPRAATARGEPPRAAEAEPPPPVQRVAPTPTRVLAGYRLREAFRGNALVETRRGVIDVQPGDVLPGAGRVLAIQKRGGRWVVATESGDIVGAPAPAPRRRPAWREEYGYEAGALAPPLLMPF